MQTISEFGRVDCVWQHESGYYTSLGIFTHDLVPRIQSWSPLRAWDEADPNAVQGTDEHPLTLIFYLHDSGNVANPRAFLNNGYVELNLDDEHAPTDYIWRGKRAMDYESGDPECCPEGPYPIICQQVRQVNLGNYEQEHDLQYLNDHCPSLVPPFDPETGTGKTWPVIAFGFLAIGDKDPCKCAEQGLAAHLPQMNHPMLFDGNVWRELRNSRGNALTVCPPDWGPGDPTLAGPETTMEDSGGGGCGDFSLAGGTHKVYLKLTTNKILIWMYNNELDGPGTGDSYCGAFDRVYKGPFNRIALGVGPGCELQDKATQGDSYTCKVGGTPKQCLTYADKETDGPNPQITDGYWRTQCDAMSLLDGVLVQNTNTGACCVRTGPNAGTCSEGIGVTEATCTAQGGIWHGSGTTCAEYAPCCPYPFADGDHDGDVDQADFGLWQGCFDFGSGLIAGCECFDQVAPIGSVDGDDLFEFSNCFTGANVPFSAAALPSCSP